MSDFIAVNLTRAGHSRNTLLESFLIVSKILNVIWPPVICVGLISNTINIVVFLKSGVKDSVATLLLTLSISDAIYLLLVTPSIFTFIFTTPKMTVYKMMHLLLYWPAYTFYDFSAYIAVFLGVTRCACVAMPLHFKSVFTRNRTVVAVVILFCSSVLLHIPVLTISRLAWTIDPKTNSSRITLIGDSPAEKLKKMRINDVLNKNSIAWISFIIMISCVALLSFKLFEASKLRSRPKSSNETSAQTSQDTKLSPKDVHVVKSVVLVCSIFIVTQLPSVVYTALRSGLPGFYQNGRFDYILGFLIRVSNTCYLLNASVNILVYYNYNSRYRSELRLLLKLK